MKSRLAKYLKYRLIILLIFTSLFSKAQDSRHKAIFLSKFIEYMDWPQGKSEVKIGVLGAREIYEELLKLAEYRGYDLLAITSPKDAITCHLVYIPENENKRALEIAKVVQEKSVLVVTDKKEQAGKIGEIAFFTKEGKLNFVIDERAVRAKKIGVSSKLMNVATVVSQ